MVHCRVCCRRCPCQSSITPFARQCTAMLATSNTYRIYSSVLDGEKVATTHAKVIISIVPESLNQFINFEMSHPHVHTRFARSDRWQRRPDGHSTWRQTLSVVGSNQLGHRLRRTKSTRRLHKDIRIQRLDQSNITILSFYIFLVLSNERNATYILGIQRQPTKTIRKHEIRWRPQRRHNERFGPPPPPPPPSPIRNQSWLRDFFSIINVHSFRPKIYTGITNKQQILC